MLFFKKKKKDDAIEIKAYFEGTVLPLEKVNDPMFSDKLMGDGVAIEPDAGNLYAPVDGKVASIFDTKHAIGFVLDNGAEVLMHIQIMYVCKVSHNPFIYIIIVLFVHPPE